MKIKSRLKEKHSKYFVLAFHQQKEAYRVSPL